jgi:dihydrofolate reductase
MAGAWPERAGDPFADFMNSVQKYVVSDTLTEADINWKPTTIIGGADLVKEVSALRQKQGGDVSVMGSATLVRALLANDLVDELMLMIEPIVLGGGKTIFPADGASHPFELISTVTATTGVQICRYEPAR